MTRPRVPSFAKTADWPRLVSNAVTATQNDISALQAATDWGALADYADDTAAAAGGIEVGQIYRNGSVVMVRVS